eukprot:Em0020g322a
MGESLPGFKTPVPITLHSKRDAVPSTSVTLGDISLVLQLLSRSDTGVRGDVTVKSKVAGIPPVQLFTKATAGRDLERPGSPKGRTEIHEVDKEAEAELYLLKKLRLTNY